MNFLVDNAVLISFTALAVGIIVCVCIRFYFKEKRLHLRSLLSQEVENEQKGE